MKKLFLLLSAGVFALSVNAQQSSSLVIKHDGLSVNGRSVSYLRAQKSPGQTAAKVVNKNTNTSTGGWFNYFQELYIPTIGAEYTVSTYPDSSLYDDDPNVMSNVFVYGLGVSFDPTDSAFQMVNVYNTDINGNSYNPPPIVVKSNNAFEIDTVVVSAQYIQNNANYTDSAILDLAYVTGSNNSLNTDSSTLLAFTPAGTLPGSYSICYDGTPRTALPAYDTARNRISGASTKRYGVQLDANTDTSQLVFIINPPFQVPAGGKVLSYTHFKSGNVYPLNTPASTANYLVQVGGDPTAVGDFPMQSSASTGYHGSYQTGLWSTRQSRYDTGFCVYNNVSNLNELLSNIFYTSPTQLDAPDVSYYINCTTCVSLSVATVKNIVSSISAYPSPANTELYIPFTLSATANVNVTVTNTLGQVVKSEAMGNVASGKASFNTANLAGGVYFYTVNAGGQRSTGRVLIAH